MKLHQLHALADDFGLIDRRVAVPASISRGAWRYAHRAGLLLPIHYDLSRLADVPGSPEQRIMAAIRAVSPSRGTDRAMAAGRTGAYLLGVGVPAESPIHV